MVDKPCMLTSDHVMLFLVVRYFVKRATVT